MSLVPDAVINQAALKFGQVFAAKRNMDYTYLLVIWRDNPVFPDAPCMTIKASYDAESESVAFAYGHYDLTESKALAQLAQ